MGREIIETVFKVRGPGIQPASNYRRMYLVVMLSGFTFGLDVAGVLYIKAPRSIAETVQVALAGLAGLAAVILLVLERRRRSAWMVKLQHEMGNLYEVARTDLTQQYPDDPAFVDAIIEQMREQFTKQTKGIVKP
jgi:hypothetical protein